MKFIKSFQLFEKTVKYSKNYSPDHHTWLKDITSAQTRDAYEAKGKKDDKDFDPVKYQRELANNMDVDNKDWSKASPKEVRDFMNKNKKQIKDENESSKSHFSVNEKINSLVKDGKVKISLFGDSVPSDLKAKFVVPCIHNALSPREAWLFVKDTTSIDVECTDRSVVNKWDVLYSGTITNSEGKTINFSKVNNGLAVTIG